MGLQVAPILKIFLINLIRGGNPDSRTPQPPPTHPPTPPPKKKAGYEF